MDAALARLSHSMKKRGDTLGRTASVSFVDMRRQSSVAPRSPSAAPPLGQAASVAGASSRFFGVSARGAKLTRPLSTTADLGVVFTVRVLSCLAAWGWEGNGGGGGC